MTSTADSSLTPAEIYEFAVLPLLGPAAERLLDVAKPRPGERVLDVGCGTGAVARLIVSRGGATGCVVGLDPSPDMLAMARAVGEREGLAIDWRLGEAEALPFPSGSFELVLCQFALTLVADRPAVAAELRRVLVPGGRVGIHVFQGIERHPFYLALDRAITRRLGTSGIRDNFSLGDADALHALLIRAGFADIEIAPMAITASLGTPAEFLAGEIAIDAASNLANRRLDTASRRALVACLQHELAGPLRDVTSGDQVVMTFHTYVARAYR